MRERTIRLIHVPLRRNEKKKPYTYTDNHDSDPSPACDGFWLDVIEGHVQVQLRRTLLLPSAIQIRSFKANLYPQRHAPGI